MAEFGTVKASPTLMLRETPGGTIKTKLPDGSTVQILEDQGAFLKVDANGQVGFVDARFILRGASGAGATGAVPSGSFHSAGTTRLQHRLLQSGQSCQKQRPFV